MADTPKHASPPNSSASENSKEPTQKIAVLFTDMKGSTTFYKKHGNLAGRIMIQKLNDMLFPIIQKHRGVVVKTIGDSIMAYFTSPAEALWAAVKMQKHLQEYNRENSAENRLLIRTAINYGHGIIEKNDIFGDVVNIAGKLISNCDALQIIVTESLYEKVKNIKTLSFTRYRIKDVTKELKGLILFQANWETAETPEETGRFYLLTLSIEKNDQKSSCPATPQTALRLLKQDADRTVSLTGSGANLIFNQWTPCIEAAKEALRTYLDAAPAGQTLPHVLRFGLHSMDAEDLDSISSVSSFSDPLYAGRKADPYGIMLTAAFHSSMSPEYRSACTIHQEYPEKIYVFHCDDLKKQSRKITNLIPETERGVDTRPCFYCSSTSHSPGQCPSKFIRKKTSYLEKLGYIPSTKLHNFFQKNFSSIVRPLKSGTHEERFEMLFKENCQDLYTKAFFSFYEISELFQLRSLRQIYLEKNPNIKNPQSPKEILLGEDCLRVSKQEEAQKYFLQALKEQPEDYRALIALGIFCIEASKADEAVSCFTRALSFSMDSSLKNYIHLLIARVYETSGAPDHALAELKKTDPSFSGRKDIIYYSAVLLAKTGEIDAAVGMFTALIRFSLRYHLMIALNPELNTVQDRITGLLTKEFTSLKNKSSESIEKIRSLLEECRHSLDQDNEEYLKADALYRKALTLYREESPAGLLDIQGFEININALITGAASKTFGRLRRKISAYRKVLDDNFTFLDRFPYNQVLSKKDFDLQDEFKALIDDARQTVGTLSPKHLNKAKELTAQLQAVSAKVVFNQKRLDIISKMLFVMEFCLKSFFVFFISGLVTTFIFTSILVGYKIYESSGTAGLATDEFIRILKFGISAGIVSATFCTGLWMKKKYS